MLDWSVGGQCVCLVGPGDSTKSTIIDAIELALSQRYRLYLDDSDFFQLNVDEPIDIQVTIGPVPESLQTEARFGLYMRGWSEEDGLHDEPEGHTPVLTVRLEVDASLEPRWTATTARDPEGKSLSAADRAHFGAARLGLAPDWQLSWRRGSILSRLTGDTESLPGLLAQASRAARVSLEQCGDELAPLEDAAKQAQQLGEGLGLGAQDAYRPGLDVQSVTIREGGLALHDGVVPLRRLGLGSRRLLLLALQHHASHSGGVTLVDEVEHGLEPYRVRQLVSNLGGSKHDTANAAASAEQVMMATHSSVVVEQLDVRNIRVVRNTGGVVTIEEAAEELQSVVRRSAEALLARKIIVCEGKTETGVLVAFDKFLQTTGSPPFATSGVALTPGGGSEAARNALQLASLGYEVAYFGDSDVEITPSAAELENSGVAVFRWDGGYAIEDRVFSDLPWAAVVELLAAVQTSGRSVREAVCAQAEGMELADKVAAWVDSPQLRSAVAAACKAGEWLKRVNLGEQLGEVICGAWDEVQGSNLEATLSRIRNWSHPNGHT